MAVEAVHRFPVNQEEAPDGLARFEALELRPGEGLVGISGENQTRVRDLGHLVVELAQQTGGLGEEVILAEPAGAETLQDEITRLEEQLETERQQHAGEIEALKREHNEELMRMQRQYDEDLARLRADFEEFKQKVECGERTSAVTVETEPETPLDPAEPQIQPATLVTAEFPDGRKMERVSTVSGVWHDPEGREYITVMGEDKNPVSVLAERVIVADEHEPIPENTKVDRTTTVEATTPRGPLVVEETEERRGWWPADRRVGAAALVGAGVLGAVLWEVIGERIFGFHDGGMTKRELTNIINNNAAALKHQEAVNHAAEMKAIANARHDELQAIHGVYKEVSRDHQQELKAIHGIRERMNESDTFTAAKFAIRYPWDWAADKVGIYRATPWLHTLAGRAAAHGHKVQWFLSGRRTQLWIDGKSNTPYIVKVLNRYS